MQPDQLKSIQLKKGKITINVKNNQYDVIREIAENIFRFKLSYSNDQDFDLYWTNNQMPIEFYYKLKIYQKVNFIPGIEQICRKNLLNQNFKIMQKKFPLLYDFSPKTWNLPSELRQFKTYTLENQNKFFIIKPESMCQGKGIQIIQKFEEIDQYESSYVAQEYIHNPFLIEHLKWDIRFYVLIAGTDPLRIFLYQEGLARFATVPYQQPNKLISQFQNEFDKQLLASHKLRYKQKQPKFQIQFQ